MKCLKAGNIKILCSQYLTADNTLDNYLAYDNIPNCLVAQTDGSFDNGVSGYGVYYKLDA